MTERNVMTEDEAKKRWCPDARVELAASNRIPSDSLVKMPGTLCMGSQCMAWRWDRTFVTPVEPTVGYCGRAGRP